MYAQRYRAAVSTWAAGRFQFRHLSSYKVVFASTQSTPIIECFVPLGFSHSFLFDSSSCAHAHIFSYLSFNFGVFRSLRHKFLDITNLAAVLAAGLEECCYSVKSWDVFLGSSDSFLALVSVFFWFALRLKPPPASAELLLFSDLAAPSISKRLSRFACRPASHYCN